MREFAAGTGMEYLELYQACKKIIDRQESVVGDWSSVQSLATEKGKTVVVQGAANMVMLYQQAATVQPLFDAAMQQLTAGVNAKSAKPAELTCAKLKHLFRVVEKTRLDFHNRDDAKRVQDIVRCMVVCHSKQQMLDMFQALVDSPAVVITRVKNRWDPNGLPGPTEAGWADIMVNVRLAEDVDFDHVCEVQICHFRMLQQRKTQGGHGSYAFLRAAQETLEYLKAEDAGKLTVEEVN